MKNGRYHGTYFSFNWFSSDLEKAIFFLKGSHYADSKTPPADNLYNFGRAAESAWYDYVTPRIDAEFTHKGSVNSTWSPISGLFSAAVSFKSWTRRAGSADVPPKTSVAAKLDDGVLTIRRKDAKSSFFDLFNREGVFGFNYAAMHNARLFLYLFQKSLGIRVQ